MVLVILFALFRARVAELADALDSGSSPRKGVQVRLLSWAPLRSCLRLSDAANRREKRTQPILKKILPQFLKTRECAQAKQTASKSSFDLLLAIFGSPIPASESPPRLLDSNHLKNFLFLQQEEQGYEFSQPKFPFSRLD